MCTIINVCQRTAKKENVEEDIKVTVVPLTSTAMSPSLVEETLEDLMRPLAKCQLRLTNIVMKTMIVRWIMFVDGKVTMIGDTEWGSVWKNT